MIVPCYDGHDLLQDEIEFTRVQLAEAERNVQIAADEADKIRQNLIELQLRVCYHSNSVLTRASVLRVVNSINFEVLTSVTIVWFP